MGFLLFLVILVAAWQGCYWIGVDLLGLWKPYAMPSPVGVAQRLCHSGGHWCGLGAVNQSFPLFTEEFKALGAGNSDLTQCLLGALFYFVVWAFHPGNFICSGDGCSF